jgi:hypothetical protein
MYLYMDVCMHARVTHLSLDHPTIVMHKFCLSFICFQDYGDPTPRVPSQSAGDVMGLFKHLEPTQEWDPNNGRPGLKNKKRRFIDSNQ